MDKLSELLDNQTIDKIGNEIDSFLQPAGNHPNRLKVAFVLLHTMMKCNDLLSTIDVDEFISDIKKRIIEVEEQSKSLTETYQANLIQDQEIYRVLADNSSRVTEISDQIQTLLLEYDNIIKRLVQTKESLPLETQLNKDNNS